MNEKQEYYWSLILESGWVQAGVWTIEEKKAKVMSRSQPLAWEAEEDLVEVVNAALSAAVQDFPEGADEPTKTVFGVPPSWVSEGQIGKEHLDKIREICAKLSLTPSGFVVLPEAIAHAVKVEEGSPLTGVIIGLGKSVLDITIFRLGNLVGTVNVGRSVAVVDDVVEGLVRFATGEHLPSRMMIYDGKEAELEEMRQSLIGAEWEEVSGGKVKFLHDPKIEIIEAREKVTAVCLAGASEIGEIEGVIRDEKEEEATKPEREEESEKKEEPEKVEEVEEGQSGFVLDEDIQKLGERRVSVVKKEEGGKREGGAGGRLRLPRVRIRLPKLAILKREKRASLPRAVIPGTGGKKLLRILAGLLAVGLVGLVGAWWFLPKAEVVVYVAPQTLEEAVMVVLDEGVQEGDVEEMMIPAETVKVEVSGEKTRLATGARVVGEKSRGVVTVRNGTAAGVKLVEGTVLVGPNELKFSTEEEASVSAAQSPSSPGTKAVKVAAQEIGAEYNLAKGEVLAVGNYPKSELDAVVEDDFGGGSSREIVAVSEEDTEELEEDLTEELVEKGRGEIEVKKVKGRRFIGEEVGTRVVSADFNQKVGDEAANVRLRMTLEVMGLVVSEEEINKLAREVLATKVPSGFVLRDEQIEADFELETEGDGWWEFEVRFRASLLPEVSESEIARKVAGKYPPTAEDYLQSAIAGYRRSEVRLRPSFPGRLGVIPRVVKNISVKVVADR